MISSSCHFFRISCQTLIMLDMPRFWIARLNLKWNCGCNDRNFMSDLFQIFMRILMVMTVLQKEQCSVTFPGLARSPLQKSNWFSQSSTCTNYVIKLVAHPCAFAFAIFRLHGTGVGKKIPVYDHFHLTPLWSIAEKYLLLAFVLSHNLGDIRLILV